MIKVKGLFAVSLIAILMAGGVAVNSAVAAIASKGYVDQQVGSKANATDLERKVDIYQGDAKANQAVITNGTGNITTGFITKSMLGADVEIPDEYELSAATANALGGVKSGGDITVATSGAVTVNSATKATQDASGNEITKTYATKNELTSGLAGKEVTSNKVTSTNYTENVSSDTKYPTVKAVANAIADVEEKIPAKITVDSALSSTSTNPVQNKVINSALAGKQATLTSTQLNAVNSGITSTKVSTYDGYNEKITAAQNAADDAASAAATAQQTANAKVTANAAITAGTATKITYDAKGLVTGGASLTESDIPTISSNKVSGLATVATTGSYDDLADKPSIPSAYVLKAATADALGGVKSGDDITVGTDGAVTVSHAANADSATTATSADHADTATSATKATQDASGRVITTTYATKSEITGLNSSSTGGGAVVTGVSQSAGKVSVTRGNVKIPVGGENATSYATIWIE